MSRELPSELAQQVDELTRKMAANRTNYAARKAKPAFDDEAEAWKWHDLARLEIEMVTLTKEMAALLKPEMN